MRTNVITSIDKGKGVEVEHKCCVGICVEYRDDYWKMLEASMKTARAVSQTCEWYL